MSIEIGRLWASTYKATWEMPPGWSQFYISRNHRNIMVRFGRRIFSAGITFRSFK